MGEMENLVMMGDFNSVKNALDRYPHREDEETIKEAWSKIRNKFKMMDGWRIHNPIKKKYTYIQKGTKRMSRIDRMYINNEVYLFGYNWTHVETAISDHDMVIVDILKAKLPFIGKGM